MKILLFALLAIVGARTTAYLGYPAIEQHVQFQYLITAPVAMVVVLGWFILNRK